MPNVPLIISFVFMAIALVGIGSNLLQSPSVDVAFLGITCFLFAGGFILGMVKEILGE